MTTLRQAAQQALKSMDDHMYRADTHEFYEAKEALRAALAEPEQEPVAWISESENLLSWDKFYDHMKPLYTAPTARQPLTEQEIQTIWAKTFEMGSSANTFARAIEKAHGIKEQEHDAAKNL